MLRFFRQKGMSNALYGVIIVGTLLTFVIEFRPNATRRSASLSEACAARVRGRCIEPKDFKAAFRMLVPRGGAALRRVNLKKVALDGLIERELLIDEARRVGIRVSDDELTDQLYAGFVRVSVPAADPALAGQVVGEMVQSYYREGLLPQEVAQAHYNEKDTAIPVDFRDARTKRFDIKMYERRVREISNRSTTEFREEQARELLAAKMRDVVRDPVRLSTVEAWEEYRRRYETATVTWVPVKETWAERWATTATPSEAAAWANEHKDVFDKALDARGKQDAPQAGHVRHILVKVAYKSDDEKATALAKLSWAAARIRAGEPFAEVARDTSDDTQSAAQGGDVGDKTDGFVTPFRAAADALRPGETTSGAIETQFGYHLITKDDPARAAEVQALLAKTLPRSLVAKERSTAAAQRVAKAIGDNLGAGKSSDVAVHEAIAPYVHPQKVELLRVLPPPPPEDGGASDDASAAGAAAKASKPEAARTFDASSDPDCPEAKTSSAFNAGGDPFPGLTPEATANIVRFAFDGKVGDARAEPVRTSEGYDAVALKERKVATREEFDTNRDTFEQELLQTKRDEALALYVRRLRDQAKDEIKVDPSYIEDVRGDGGPAPADDEEDQY